MTARRGAEIKKLKKDNIDSARRAGLDFVEISDVEAECQMAAVTAQHSLQKITKSLSTASGLIVPKSALLIYNDLAEDHVWIVVNSRDFVSVIAELKNYTVAKRTTLDDLDFQSVVSLLCGFGYEFEVWGIDTFNQMFRGRSNTSYYSMERNFGQPIPQEIQNEGDDDEEDDRSRPPKHC